MTTETSVDPIRAFEALAHETRFAVLRVLIPVGRDGLAAGVIGERVRLPPNALSFHLARLMNAGLVAMRRVGRNRYYAVDYARLGALVRFLADDCCAEAPDGCLPECPGPSRMPGRRCRAEPSTRASARQNST